MLDIEKTLRDRTVMQSKHFAEDNNWSNKVLQARHDRLLEYVYSLWYDFIKYQNMVNEYRRTKKIDEIDREGKWISQQLGSSLLEDVILSQLPITDKQVDEDRKRMTKGVQ